MINSRHFLLLASVLCAGCSPVELRFADERVDLGAVLPGAVRRQEVRLISKSKSIILLAGTSSTHPNFTLLSPEVTLLPPSDITTLVVTHTPPEGASEPEEARLRVWTEDGLEAWLDVTSLPLTPNCDGPNVLDFGAVKPGESSTLELTFTNDTPLDSEALVDPIASPRGEFVAELGRYPVRAGREVKVPVTFQPRSSGDFAGAITVRRHPLCAPQRVTLFGTGVPSLLAPIPGGLSWSTGVGATETQLLIVRNNTSSPVALYDVQVREGPFASQVFRAVRFPLRIPAAVRSEGRLNPGTAAIEASFTPMAIQRYAGQLSFNTDFAMQPRIEVELAGFGR